MSWSQSASGGVTEAQSALITGAAQKASNLSDLASASTGRTSLGLGTMAVKRAASASVPPTVADDSSAGYTTNDTWVDTVTNLAYMCVDAAVGAAVWTLLGAALAFTIADDGAITFQSNDFTPSGTYS